MSEDESQSDANNQSSTMSSYRPPLGEDSIATLMRREGRQTVDNLNSGLSDIDTKASKLMRTNIVLAGLLLSGFSFASKSNSIEATPFVNSFSISGIAVLVGSIVAAGVTYTGTESRVGVSPQTIQSFVSSDLKQSEVDRGLAKAYARWITINRRANIKNAFYISVTTLLVLTAVILLSVAVFVGAFSGFFSTPLHLGAWFIVLVLVGIIGSISNVRRDYEEWKNVDK